MALSNHSREIREGDETYCPTCGKRWDTNDPYPPKCISDYDVNRRNGLKRIDQLKRTLK